MKRLNKMIVCLGALLVFSMGLNFSAHTIYAQENIEIVNEGKMEISRNIKMFMFGNIK